MPVLDLQFVGPVPCDAQPLADALAPLFDAAPGTLWLRLHSLPAAHYAENAAPLPEAERPVFARLLLRRWPAPDERARLARELAALLARQLGRPAACMHIEFAPPGEGRIAFGGELLR